MPSVNSVSKSPLPCPRCDSINTKFCYFNNYNFSQPRHFCKSCRRYWTHGGALRDIPVGGGTRKTSKRCRSSAASTAVSSARTQPVTEPFHGNPLINSTNSFVSMLSGFGFGPELGAWAFPDGGGYVSGAINGGGVPSYRGANGGDTWNLENGVAADFFPSFPQLGISHTGNGLK